MTATGDLDRDRIRALHASELAAFEEARPRTMELLERARAHMPNGVPMAWMASDNDRPVYVRSVLEQGYERVQKCALDERRSVVPFAQLGDTAPSRSHTRLAEAG